MGSVSIGIDLGQRRDSTAICVAEEEMREEDKRRETYYQVRFLRRLPLGMAYPDQATRIAEIVDGVVARQQGYPAVYADATGVGLPVCDILRGAGIQLTPVLFNHGDKRTVDREQGRVSLGKAWLVSRLQALLATGRVLLPDTDEARALADELINYEIRLSEDADFKAGAFKVGTHDDLVTALGLAMQSDQPALPFAWIRNNPAFEAQFQARKKEPAAVETTEERLARRMAARGMVEDVNGTHKYGAPLPNPWLPTRHE